MYTRVTWRKKKTWRNDTNELREQTSTVTLVDEVETLKTTTTPHYKPATKNKDCIARKLNRLKDERIRYKSHKVFLSWGSSEELI